MFEKLRKPGRGKSITATLIFGAIVIVFVFFNTTPGNPNLGSGGVAAIVNSEVVPLADFRDAYQRLEERYKQQLAAIPAAQRQRVNQDLRSQALEELVNREVIYQTAVDLGIMVPDNEVVETILNIPAFQEQGRFQRTRYDAYLQGTNMSSLTFETKLRRDLAMNRLRSLFVRSLEPLPTEIEKDKEARSLKVNVEFVRLDRDDVRAALKATPAQVEAFLKDDANQQKVKEYYEANKVQFTDPEQVRARHILVRFEPGKSDSESKAASAVQKLAERAQTEDFAKLAQEASEDPGSKDKGGDLGFFSRGRMVPEFEQAAFGANVGTVTGPIKTNYGYHLIKVEEKRPGGSKTLDEVRERIARDLIGDESYAKALDNIRKALAEGQAAAVASELKNLGVKWEETGRFELAMGYMPKIGESEAILEKVLAVREPGQMVKELVAHDAGEYVLKLKEVVTEALPSSPQIAGVSDAEFLAARRANDAFSTWATEAKKEARIQRNAQLVAN